MEEKLIFTLGKLRCQSAKQAPELFAALRRPETNIFIAVQQIYFYWYKKRKYKYNLPNFEIDFHYPRTNTSIEANKYWNGD